jgi:hypothetical protein
MRSSSVKFFFIFLNTIAHFSKVKTQVNKENTTIEKSYKFIYNLINQNTEGIVIKSRHENLDLFMGQRFESYPISIKYYLCTHYEVVVYTMYKLCIIQNICCLIFKYLFKI